jgi:response regulator of citrate/malate metabolism
MISEEENRINRKVKCATGKTDTFSITLDTGHEEAIRKVINQRENKISMSKVIGWALEDFFKAKGFQIINDQRDRKQEADVLLPTTIEIEETIDDAIKTGETRIFPIRSEIIHYYFLEYTQEIHDGHISISQIYKWALDGYFSKE